MQDIEAQLAKKKAAADSSLKFDDYYTALSQYVSAVTSSELAPTADQLLQEATRLLAAGDWQRAAALEAVGQLLHGPQSSTIGQGIHAACMDESAKAEQSVIVAALTGALASEPTTVPASLAGIASNLALCATHLRLWPQVLVSSLAACLFSEPLRAKNVARYAVAARHLGVKVDVPVQFMDESLSTLLNRIEKELFGKYDFAAFAKGGAANVPLAEYRGSFTVQKSQGRGFGLFAKAAFAVGDVVLCEHAVGYSNLSDDTDGSAALARLRQSTELGCTGFEMRRVIHVYDGTPRSDDAINDADFADLVGVPAFVPLRFFTPEVAPQTLEHLSGVITYNAYTGEHYVEQAPSDWLSIGLFPTSALINHDARPNVTRQCVGRFLIFRTLRPINVGDEILGTYVAASAYLADDNLLQRWGVVEVARAPEVKKLRALDDCLGASIEKLVPFMEASSSGLLSAVEPPTRAAFICNAGLFAAIARLDNHPALQALVDLLSTGQPELSLLEQCCKIIAKFERKMNKDTVKRLRALLEQWCDVCLGHRNLVAAASRRVT